MSAIQFQPHSVTAFPHFKVAFQKNPFWNFGCNDQLIYQIYD